MSTTPSTPNIIIESPAQAVSWLKQHERIILVVLGLAVALWLGNKWLNYSSKNDDAKLTAAQQVLTTQQQQNQQLAQKIDTETQQYVSLSTQLAAQNQQLLAVIAQRNQATTVQQQKDQVLPLSDLGARWHLLVPQGTVSNTPSGLLADESASRATVSQLEEVPTLQQNFADDEKIIQSKNQQLDSSTSLNSDYKKQVDGLNLQLTDADRVCNDKIKSVTAKGRKSKLKWFLTGLGIGAGLVAKAVL